MKNELTAAQLVDTYRISLNKDASGNFTGMVRIENAKRCKADKALEAIQAAKQEIIAILQERGETEARARAEHAANYQKASAGRKAMEAIIDGADPEETIKAMVEEWSAATMAHMWD